MCGICGIADFSGSNISSDILLGMTTSIRHRGPDDMGIYACGPIGLGHARLSIIDPSPAGHQPMVSGDGQCVLIYNGETYNYRDLMGDLKAKGYRFTGHSDSETILNAYLEWGIDTFSKIEGMFAFALWDGRSRELHLVRDRFGIKPLYYYPFKSGLIFGSEVKAILASGLISRDMDWESLNEFLYYGVALGEHSLFSGVKKLLPGNRIVIDESRLEIIPYVSIYELNKHNSVDSTGAITEVRDHVEAAVKSHLVSDVPVGVFLSGGIDSSTITAYAAKHYAGKLCTYSAGFDFAKGSTELARAKRVAEFYGTDHHEVHIQGSNAPDVIESLVRCHDEPFGDIADLPLYLICEQLRGSVKVILQGDGGDEIFAGYRHYNVLSAEGLWRMVARVVEPFKNIVPKSPASYRYMRFFQAMRNDDPAMRMALLLTEEPLDSPPTRALSNQAREMLAPFDPYARYRHFYELFQDLDPVQRMLYTDCGIMLPDIFLEKVDKSTMAHGIEVRVPMLDTKLTNYVMGLPSSMKVKLGHKKWILRQAMRGIVPDDILDAPKAGFGVPYSYWLRTSLEPYMRSVLLDAGTLEWGLFDPKALESCINEHVEGRRNNGFLLYKLLVLILWRRFYLKT